MKVIDLNIMELEFLDVLRFRLSVRKEEYERWRTALYNFRNQLMNVPAELQRQKLMETMALSVGNNQQWMQYNQQPQYNQQQIKQQQQLQQQQQQQHAAAVAAVTHNFFLFSKSQQQYPVQPTFNGPLTRVPLRIPTQPVYHNVRNTSTTSTNPVYENRSNIVLPNPTPSATPTPQIYSSTNNRRQAPVTTTTTESVYTPYHQQNQPQSMTQHVPSQASLPPPTTTRTNTSKVTTPYSQVSPFNPPNPQPSYNRGYTSNNASSTRASHRTSSLPQAGGLDLSVKNSSYYYTPPTATTPSAGYNNGYSTTSYYVDPTSTNTPTVLSTGQSDYNPYNDVYNNRPMIPRSTSYKVRFYLIFFRGCTNPLNTRMCHHP